MPCDTPVRKIDCDDRHCFFQFRNKIYYILDVAYIILKIDSFSFLLMIFFNENELSYKIEITSRKLRFFSCITFEFESYSKKTILSIEQKVHISCFNVKNIFSVQSTRPKYDFSQKINCYNDFFE